MGADVTLLSQYVTSGLLTGFLYVLMGLGITFIYSIMKMINWAMGQFYMVGGYLQFLLVTHVVGIERWYLAVLISAATVFLLGLVLQPLLIKPMFRELAENRDSYGTQITLGLFLFLTGAALVFMGAQLRSPGTNVPNMMLGVLPISGASFAASIGAIIALILFYVGLRYTWTGLALRAASQSREGVQIAGINVYWIDAVAFGIGVALAGVAGALLAPVYMIYPTAGLIVTVKGFEIIVIGGLGSIKGTVIAGLALGLIEGLGSALISPGYQNVYGFVLLILVLIFRPRGLFGERLRTV